MASESAQETSQEISPEDIVAFLKANPNFFDGNRALLAELNLPHASGRAISLVERQVDILRERNMEMRKRVSELMDSARANDDLFSKTRTLTLALLDGQSLSALNESLATHLLVDAPGREGRDQGDEAREQQQSRGEAVTRQVVVDVHGADPGLVDFESRGIPPPRVGHLGRHDDREDEYRRVGDHIDHPG